MSDFEQLKPCPFCGHAPEVLMMGNEDYYECHNLACGNCANPVATKKLWNTRSDISSMQGEAVGVVTLADDISQPDTSGEHKGKYQNMIYSSAPLQVGAHVYTNAPYSAARIAEQSAEIARLKKLSVTNIMIDIVPGDGSGVEIYAKSVEDVEKAMTKLAMRLDDNESTIYTQRQEIARLQKELEEARKVPEGYALVPIEPTIEMLEAANSAKFHSVFDMARPIYKAMLSAAPDASLNIKEGAE